MIAVARWLTRFWSHRWWASAPLWIATLAGLIVASGLSGCRLPKQDGPVSRSLATSRQLSQRGVTAAERKDWASAETLFAQAVDTCEVDAEARQHYAQALWQRDHREQALAQIDEAIRLSGDDKGLLIQAAEMRLALKDFEGARRNARSAIDLDPQSPEAWAIEGRIFSQGGAQREALAAYQRALSQAPDNRDLLLALAETYRQLNEPQRALVKLQSLADTYPTGDEPQQVLYLEGLALSALGRHAAAATALATACERGPAGADLWCRLAEAQWRSGQWDAARRNVDHALQLDPQSQLAVALQTQLNVAQSNSSAERR